MKRSSFIFKEKHLFIEEDNRSDKTVMVEEELDDIDVVGIGNLVDLPRLMFITKENVGVLKWSLMVESLLEIIAERRVHMLTIDVNSVICNKCCRQD